MSSGHEMRLLYRVAAAEVSDVLAGLRAQGFDGASDDRMVGRGHKAMVVRVRDEDEAAEVADAMVLLDQTAELLATD